MKTRDLLQQYHALRSALAKERETIEERLQEINTALGTGGSAIPLASPPTPKKLGRPPGKRKSVENTMPLREAVLKVLTATPVTRQELLAAVQKTGYRFASNEPLNSLQTFLYGSGKKLVKKVDGKFAALGKPTAAVPKPEEAAPKKKRKLSAAGRKAIAEAVRKRWSKVHAEKKAMAPSDSAKK